MKVRQSTDDEDTICRIVVSRLSGKQGISFDQIARTAYDEGRGRLATQVYIYLHKSPPGYGWWLIYHNIVIEL